MTRRRNCREETDSWRPARFAFGVLVLWSFRVTVSLFVFSPEIVYSKISINVKAVGYPIQISQMPVMSPRWVDLQNGKRLHGHKNQQRL